MNDHLAESPDKQPVDLGRIEAKLRALMGAVNAHEKATGVGGWHAERIQESCNGLLKVVGSPLRFGLGHENPIDTPAEIVLSSFRRYSWEGRESDTGALMFYGDALRAIERIEKERPESPSVTDVGAAGKQQATDPFEPARRIAAFSSTELAGLSSVEQLEVMWLAMQGLATPGEAASAIRRLVFG